MSDLGQRRREGRLRGRAVSQLKSGSPHPPGRPSPCGAEGWGAGQNLHVALRDVYGCGVLLSCPQATFPRAHYSHALPSTLGLVRPGTEGAAHLAPTQAQPSSTAGLHKQLRSGAPGTAGNLVRPTSEVPTPAPCTLSP